MTAISRNKVKIWITTLGTAASTLVMTGTGALSPILGEIKSYARNGGEDQVESDAVFGGYVDMEKPKSQVELSFDVVPALETGSRWDSLIFGRDVATNVWTMATDSANKTIFIQYYDASAGSYSWGFNNANAVSFTVDHNADDNAKGKFSFKFSPTNKNGVSNYMANTVAVTSLPAWTALDNN